MKEEVPFDVNNPKVAITLGAMLSEITSIQQNKIQRDMVGQLLQNSRPIDAKDVHQMHGFLSDMTGQVQKEGNNFIDRVYFTSAQQEQLQAVRKDPKALADLRNQIDQENPQAKASRDKVNQGISVAIANAKEGLSDYIEKVPAGKLSQAGKNMITNIRTNNQDEIKSLLTKEELVNQLLKDTIKANGLENKADKISAQLKDALLKLDKAKLADPKLKENLSKSLGNIKKISIAALGQKTVSTVDLNKVAEAMQQSSVVKAKSIKDHLKNMASKASSGISSLVGMSNQKSKAKSQNQGTQR